MNTVFMKGRQKVIFTVSMIIINLAAIDLIFYWITNYMYMY